MVVFPQVARIIRLRFELDGKESTSTNNSVSEEQAGGWVVYGEGGERKMLWKKTRARRRRSIRKQILNSLITIC